MAQHVAMASNGRLEQAASGRVWLVVRALTIARNWQLRTGTPHLLVSRFDQFRGLL
jgi:hypothetical protein